MVIHCTGRFGHGNTRNGLAEDSLKSAVGGKGREGREGCGDAFGLGYGIGRAHVSKGRHDSGDVGYFKVFQFAVIGAGRGCEGWQDGERDSCT